MECISKGKSYKRYEFGCKVSLVLRVNPIGLLEFKLYMTTRMTVIL
ncbi:hypothetical protein LEP1GSC035_2378 [Leptospira noguchii str. 2007001578]|uniref:Uncharacterized protein n=1 Tax=Leptospira noguchii str. 2007001578 TaxID=1049974 RepID=A0ABP2TAL2_9LEPT|nr:hypothetical protein LEP1GSC035_2378 [Leptospira noguchii str. 2007001578]